MANSEKRHEIILDDQMFLCKYRLEICKLYPCSQGQNLTPV